MTAQQAIAPSISMAVLHGVVIGLLEMLAFLIVLIKRKYAHWIHLGLSVFVLGTTFLSMFGTNGEFGRTAITMYPMLIVSIAVWFSILLDFKRPSKNNSIPLHTQV